MKKIIYYLITCIGLYIFILHQIHAVDQKPTKEVNFERSIYEWSKPLAEMFHLVHRKHYQNIDPEEPMKKAMTAFAKSLDGHSEFLDKKAYDEIIQSTKGEVVGIGIIVDHTMDEEDEFLRIVETIPAGPADSAGLKADDKIIEVDGNPIRGLSLEKAIAKIKGKRNTSVKLRVQRSDTIRHLNFTINRDIVKEPNALCYYFKDHNIYYLCLNMFTENSVSQLEDLLKKIQHQHTKGLILDLRNNSGGLLSSVVDISGLFLDKGSVVVITKGRNDKEIERLKTTKAPILTNKKMPIFILVNNFTASAAEILAGCLQTHANESAGKKHTHGLVFIVGAKTFGKGSVQEVIPISNNCALKLTTALYYLPDDSSIQGKGIKPDFKIEPKMPQSQETVWFNSMFGRESALKNAIKIDLQNANPQTLSLSKKTKSAKNDAEKSWYEKKQELVSSDYLILSTIRLLEMLDMSLKAYPNKVQTRKDAMAFLKSIYTPQDKANIEEIKI
jgi:carboxyl-terminal processing protease